MFAIIFQKIDPFGFSRCNEKVRWALDLKNVPHERRSLLPGPHARKANQRSGQSQVPILSFDDEVGTATRLGLFHELFEEAPCAGMIFTSDQPAWKRCPDRLLLPMLLPVVRKKMNIHPASADAAHETNRKALDRIAEASRGTGYLVGDRFTAADLTAASLLFPLSFPAALKFDMPDRESAALDRWKARWAGDEAVAWMEEIFRKHRWRSPGS